MQGTFPRRLLAVLVALAVVSGLSAAGEIHSTMRNVNAVMEAHGFRISPVYDVEAPPEPGDLSPAQVFEIERPLDKPVTIGRLFTSCSCIQLETHKRTFRPGERAILHLRNIRPTPPQGQIYAIFVQITSPVRTTLRFDTFVQTGSGDTADEPAEDEAAAEAHTDEAENHQDNPETEVEGTASLVQDVVPAAAEPEVEPSIAVSSTPLIELPAGTEVSDSVVAAEDDTEVEDIPAAPVAPTASDADMEAMESYFENGGAEPAATDTPDAGDLPDFHSQTQTMPITAPIRPPAIAPDTPATETPAVVAAASAAVAAPVAPAATVVPPRADAVLPARDPAARKPVQAVSLITIGVRDMPASIQFYEALGWRRAARGKYDQTAFFQLQGQILALYPIHDQLQEQNMVGAQPAPGGITLALHVSEKADVWAVYQRFIDAGGTVLRPPAELPSGAVSSYVADPDGNPWEISWVPQFRIDDDGGLWLP